MKYSVFTVQTPRYGWRDLAIQLKKYGYDGIEWRVSQAVKEAPNPLPPEDQWYWQYNKATVDVERIQEEAPLVRDITEEQGLALVSLSTYLTTDKRAEIEAVMRTAGQIGCPMVRLNPYVYTGSVHYQTLFEKMQRELRELQTLCEAYGVTIVLEIHMGNIIPSASAAKRLLDGLDPKWFGVIYDPGNMVHEGFEQYQMGMELLGPYLHHIHMKDARWLCQETGEHSSYEVKWCPIGDGVVDFKKLLAAARSVGYQGYYSFEDFSNEWTDEEKLERNIRLIRELESML